MNRSLRFSLGLAGLFVVAACTDQTRSPQLPTAPPSQDVIIADPCSNTLYNHLRSEAGSLFSGAIKNQALDRLKEIKNGCPSLASQNNALSYVGFTLANQGGMTATRADAFVAHWDNVFEYVGLGFASLPAASLLTNGKACVLPRTGGSCVTSPVYAGVVQGNLTVPADGYDWRVYTLTPIVSPACLTTNLALVTYCYDLDIFPAAPAGYTPPLEFFICTLQDTDVGNPLYTLGHQLNGGQTRALTRSPSATSAYGIAGCVHSAPSVAAAGGGVLGSFSRFLAAAANVMVPRTLFAANGGLGIEDDFSEGTSPLGGVDLRSFLDNFTDEAVGSPPTFPVVGQQWEITESGAGSVRVVSSWNSAFDKSVILNQAAGCTTDCGPLELRGQLQVNASNPGVFADVGKYSVKWQSGQDRPTIVNANFVLRSSGTPGQEIARLTYLTEGGLSKLKYNAIVNGGIVTGGIDVGTWVAHNANTFEIIVDLDNKKTRLCIDGIPAPGTFPVNFVDLLASNFHRLNWENGFVDSGKTAFDNISVTRLVDVDPVTATPTCPAF